MGEVVGGGVGYSCAMVKNSNSRGQIASREAKVEESSIGVQIEDIVPIELSIGSSEERRKEERKGST